MNSGRSSRSGARQSLGTTVERLAMNPNRESVSRFERREFSDVSGPIDGSLEMKSVSVSFCKTHLDCPPNR